MSTIGNGCPVPDSLCGQADRPAEQTAGPEENSARFAIFLEDCVEHLGQRLRTRLDIESNIAGHSVTLLA